MLKCIHIHTYIYTSRRGKTAILPYKGKIVILPHKGKTIILPHKGKIVILSIKGPGALIDPTEGPQSSRVTRATLTVR